MHTTINERRFPDSIRGVSDGSVAGTRFYNEHDGEQLVPAGITVQQESMTEVRIRFAPAFGIDSFVMGEHDTLIVNAIVPE